MVCIDDEISFEIPAGWEWCRLRDVCEYIQRGKSPIYSEVKKYPVIAQKCNQWTGFSIEKAQFIDPETVTKYSEERVLRDKDLLWNSTGLGTLGRIAVYLSKKNPYGWAVADSHVTVIRPLKAMAESYFLYAYFASPTVQSVIEDKAEGSTKQKELYVDTIKEYLIPFPPISEQKRIIKKIDEVLPEVFKYGKSQERLDSLNSELKDKIKKSILQEAIQGRLLPQDPNDEPASALIDRIRIEKQKLLKEGKLKTKDIVESSIFKGEDNKYYEKIGNKCLDINEEVPFDIPESWVWVRLASIANLYTGNSISETEKRVRYTNVAGKKYIGTKDVGFDHSINYDNGVAIPAKYLPDFRIAPSGSVLMCIEGGSAGRKIAILEKDVCFGNKLCCFAPYAEIAQYIYYYLQSPTFFDVFQRNKTGIIGGVSVNTLKDLLIALPPKDEQIRIVAKIQSLKL